MGAEGVGNDGRAGGRRDWPKWDTPLPREGCLESEGGEVVRESDILSDVSRGASPDL